jgi:hypothetical protein
LWRDVVETYHPTPEQVAEFERDVAAEIERRREGRD